MAKYIPLDAVLAEIEKIKDEAIDLEDKSRWFLSAAFKNRIESIEVKEMDLEEEIECSLPKPVWGWNEDYFGKSDPAYSMEQMKEFAKHFFELGLKAQKEE